MGLIQFFFFQLLHARALLLTLLKAEIKAFPGYRLYNGGIMGEESSKEAGVVEVSAAADWQCLVIRGCGLDGLSEGKWCKTVALCLVALLGPMPVAPLNEMDRLACLLAGWLASWWTGWLPGWLAGRQATAAVKIVANLSFLFLFLSFFLCRLLGLKGTLKPATGKYFGP